MQSFKKLLDTVRSKHPDLISEEAANDMLTQFDASIDQMKADALAEGQQLGFKEGYDEGKRVAADEAKRSTDELIEKLDAEQTAKLKSVIDMINDDHATKLQEVYDSLMASMVPRAEMEAMDEDHAEKFAEVLAAKDDEYTDKLNLATESIRTKLEKKIAVFDDSIAPGSSGEYYFDIQNTNGREMAYSFSVVELYNNKELLRHDEEFEIIFNTYDGKFDI